MSDPGDYLEFVLYYGQDGAGGAGGAAGPLANYLAIVSTGTFPTPIPTNTERASFAVTFGLRDSV